SNRTSFMGPVPGGVGPFICETPREKRSANLRIRVRPVPHHLPGAPWDQRSAPRTLPEVQRRPAKGVVCAQPEYPQPLQPDPGEVREGVGKRRNRQGERSAESL